MASALHHSAQTGFSAMAAAYAKGRPDYPPDVADWLRMDVGLRAGKAVADIGSGTGKFLPYLQATGAEVVAIEPVEAMRAELAARHLDVTVLDGIASRIPLADATLDAVVCAQSFHWFATQEALGEFRRVLKPGGTLGLIWNNRDVTIPWVAAIEAVTDPYAGDTPSQKSGVWRTLFPAEGFGPVTGRSYRHGHRGDPDDVIVRRILSVSYIGALQATRQDRIIARIRAMIAEEPSLSGKAEVTFPYLTAAYSCRRL